MTLRRKALLAGALTLGALMLALTLSSSAILVRRFSALERADTLQNVQRARDALFSDLAVLGATATDLAGWDDTYRFVQDRNPAYPASNLDDKTLTNLRVNLAVIVAASGEVAFAKGLDLGTGAEVRVPADVLAEIRSRPALLRHADEKAAVKGFLAVGGRPLLVVSRPILTSDYKGPIRGSLILGRALDQRALRRLSDLTHLRLDAGPWAAPPDEGFRRARSGLSEAGDVTVRTRGEEAVEGYAVLRDLDGAPAFLLRATLPRTLHQQGSATVLLVAGSLLVVALVFGAAAAGLLETAILRRLERLGRSVAAVGEAGTSSARVPVDGADELGALAAAVNRMLGELEKAEGELRRSRDELEDRVSERTAALSEANEALRSEMEQRRLAREELASREEQLRQALKMEAVGQLAGGVAHDFNNLLTAIVNYSELLKRSLRGEPKLLHYAEGIEATAERASTLTRQLLAFSRKQVLDRKLLDLNGVVAELDKMLRRLIGEHVELATKLDPALGTVSVDRGRIEQVIMNLVINARDAMPGGGRLVIETENVDPAAGRALPEREELSGPHVLISVSDTGCGMSHEVLSRAFEPFFTTKEVGKGTGLGLSTVYGIVEQSGGHVGASSEEGVGSTFRVYLPSVAVPEGAAPGDDVGVPPARAVAEGETVLLVEDEESVRAPLKEGLEEFGYVVLEAADGEEALKLLQGHAGPLDIVVTDVVMPRLGGREFAERVRETRPLLPVLFMSGYVDDPALQAFVEETGGAFIQKPFTTAVLARRLRALLVPPPGAGSSAPPS